MSEIGQLLRLMVQADKEFATSRVDVTDTPTAFTSALTGDYTRRGISLYNSTDSTSGECYVSHSASGTSADSFVLKKGEITTLKLASSLTMYLFCDSGEAGVLRAIEWA